jgi:hypothetical protein
MILRGRGVIPHGASRAMGGQVIFRSMTIALMAFAAIGLTNPTVAFARGGGGGHGGGGGFHGGGFRGGFAGGGWHGGGWRGGGWGGRHGFVGHRFAGRRFVRRRFFVGSGFGGGWGWGGCGQQFVNTPWGPRWVWVGDCW